MDRQRVIALAMIATGLLRVVVWAAALALYAVGIGGVKHLYGETAFVTILSLLALLLTDWSQVAGSFAALAASDAHHDAEHNRAVVARRASDIEEDIARLAAMQPGAEGDVLAAAILKRLAREPE